MRNGLLWRLRLSRFTRESWLTGLGFERGRCMIKAKTATRSVGTCQICEGSYRLTGGVLAHHGFKRPGSGRIIGDCAGAGELPYEVSCDACASYKASLEAHLPGVQQLLEQLRGGAVAELHVEKWVNRVQRVVLVKRGEVSACEWSQIIQGEIYEVRRRVGGMVSEIARMNKRIAGWALKPVKTFEEVLAEENAIKAERAAAIAVKNAERDTKLAAKEAAKAARRVKWEAKKAKIFDKIRALAGTGVVDADVRARAEKLAYVVCYSSYEGWKLSSLAPVATELKQLGVMAADGRLSRF
jgi:hypothetical protein